MFKLFSISISIFALLASFACTPKSDTSWQLTSPDKTILVTVFNSKNDDSQTELRYKVDRLLDGDTISIIESSPLGLERHDESFSHNLEFASVSKVKVIDETYALLHGRHSEVRNNANEFKIMFVNMNGAPIEITFRAYNDGVAFRYSFPQGKDNIAEYTVSKELTGFKLSITGKAWIQKYDKPFEWGPAYEQYYETEMPIGTASPNEEGWAFPALFQTNNHWVLITEADLGANYCGVRLEQNATDGLYRMRFPHPEDALGYGAVEPISTLPWIMPWRVIVIGSTLATIVETEIINNVSAAQMPGDFSWVKPGRSSWSWLSDPESPKNYQSRKEFVDFSAEMGWEYSLVDANWDLMKGGTVEQLIAYANSKNVGILMWYNSGGPNNKVTERPRDIIYDPIKRKAEFKRIHELGVKGVKIDFWHSDKQNIIQLYHDVLIDAAEYKILVNLHGSTIPRGWSRMYPHLVTLEAVKGEECYTFDKTYTENAPIQNTILAFTRNIIGPTDYTPVGFTNFKMPHITSFAHELALSLTFNSGIVHFADKISAYKALPSYVIDFLKAVPVAFDETRYIMGAPEKDYVVAMRKGKKWYLAGINSENKSKEIEISLPVDPSANYSMNLIVDGKNDKSFENIKSTYKKDELVKLKMLPYGGFVATLSY